MPHQRQYQVIANGETQDVQPGQVMQTLRDWRAQGIPCKVRITNTAVLPKQQTRKVRRN